MKTLELNKEGKVLGFGEIMLRLTPPNYKKVIQTNCFDAIYAGGEANVICSLSMLGHDSKILTKLPNNALGDKVIREMNAFGVDTKDIVRGDGRLGIYFLEQGQGLRNSEVIYDRANSAISMATKDDFDIEKILKDVKLIHLSGVTPALSKNMYDFTLELAKEAKKRNIVVSYDSNYRAKLWSLEQAREFLLEILPLADVVFLGILDFKNILKYDINEENDFEVQLKDCYSKLFNEYENLKLAASTKRWVNSVNNNSLQGFLFDKSDLHKSNKHTFDILDRVGGGDSFTAGVLHSMIEEYEPKKAIEFATCASVLKHSISGDINLVNKEHVQTLMDMGIENIKR